MRGSVKYTSCYRCNAVTVPERIAFCRPCVTAMQQTRRQVCICCRETFDPTVAPKDSRKRSGYYVKRCNTCARKASADNWQKPKASKERWSDRQEGKLLTLYNSGININKIAKTLRRSRWSIRGKLHELVGSTKRQQFLSTRDIHTILGINHMYRVRKWFEQGWFKGGKRIGEEQWGIEIEDFMNWLEDRNYWMLWETINITDPEIRRHAIRVREGKGFWVKTKDVMAMTSYTQNVVIRAGRSGELTFVIREKQAWFWIEDIYGWPERHEKQSYEATYGRRRSRAGS